MTPKIGDRVYCDGRYGADGSITKIERITPTGRIVCANGITYRPPDPIGTSGDWCSLATGSNFASSAIRKLTDERIEKVRIGQLRAGIETHRRSYSVSYELTREQLEETLSLWDRLVSVGK